MAARNASELRDLRDPRALRALTHPVRLRLLEALGLEGPLTATQAAELIGETPTTCSFHFRQLRKYGFVEDDGPGGGRERPWRLTRYGNSVPGWTGESDVDLASSALRKVLLEHFIDGMRAGWEERRSYPPAWQNATGMSDMVFFVNAAELSRLQADLNPVLFRYMDRVEDPALRPADALPVQMVVSSWLLRLPGQH